MYRPFVERDLVNHKQDIEEANGEFEAAIRLVIAKGIFENQEDGDWKIDDETLRRTRLDEIVDPKSFQGSTAPKRLFFRRGGHLVIDSKAVCIWSKKIWVMNAHRKWIDHEQFHLLQRQEIQDAAEFWQEERTKLMLEVGQDYVNHVSLERKFKRIFPTNMGGINQGVANFRRQLDRAARKLHPVRSDAEEMQYEDMNEEERTARAMRRLKQIEQRSFGKYKMFDLYQLYQALRKTVNIQRRDFTSRLYRDLIMTLPVDGNANKEDRKVALQYQFGNTEQQHPRRSELCIKFLEDIIRVMRVEGPAQPREYGESDAAALINYNMGQDLVTELNGLTYGVIAKTLIQRYVYTNPNEALTEIIEARKPFKQDWEKHISYITSVTEQIYHPKDEKSWSKLARIVVLTQLYPITRRMVADREKAISSKLPLELLAIYLNKNFVEEVRIEAMGGMIPPSIVPAKAIPMMATRKRGPSGWGPIERLKLMTNDYTLIGKPVRITKQYLGHKDHGEVEVNVSKRFNCDVPTEEFAMPELSYGHRQVKVGTIVAHAIEVADREEIKALSTSGFGCEACHLVGHQAGDAKCPYYQLRSSKTCSKCRKGKHEEHQCKDLKVNENPTPGVFMNLPEVRRMETDAGHAMPSLTSSSEETTESESSSSEEEEVAPLPTFFELLEGIGEIENEEKRMFERFRVLLIMEMETEDMSEQKKRRLRREAEKVVFEERSRILLYQTMFNTMMEEKVFTRIRRIMQNR